MAKVSGLQLVKPKFDWGSRDKLTEIEQFKSDCKILFDGPLSGLKDKQWVGLIVNWLGREATQILNSVDAEISSTQVVFEVLERVFRPESNQTLACFKFRKMQQRVGQTCDSYMSELRLALLECKYRNDANELLKDQFIFGIENKEIRDHLLGEISETDNSVRPLYEAHKIESKLAQRQMLGIVNPSSLVSVDGIRKIDRVNTMTNVIIVDGATSGAREIVQHSEKLVTNVVRRTTTTSKWYANPQRDHCVEIQDVIQEKGQIGPVKGCAWNWKMLWK